MLTVIPATTIYKDHYSRVLLLKLDGELRSVVFSMYAADGRQGEYFSGEILITGLNGEFINGYRASNGTLKSKFIKKKWDAKSHRSLKSTGDFCPDHGMCEVGSLCNFCLQTLDEVELTGGGSTDSGISLGGITQTTKPKAEILTQNRKQSPGLQKAAPVAQPQLQQRKRIKLMTLH